LVPRGGVDETLPRVVFSIVELGDVTDDTEEV
jgi:hypothetical protein